jgi:ABC-2 type transport system permease protein
MNVFVHELKAGFRSLATWSLSLAGFASLYMLLFGAIRNDIQVFEDVLKGLPPAAQAALGVVFGTLNTITGFYSFVFAYIVLCGAVQAVNLGVAAVGRETGGKTADFLLSKPVGRSSILAQKALAILVQLVLTNAVYLAVTIPVALSQQSDADLGQFALLSATLFFVQVVFAALGLLFGTVVEKVKSVVAVSLPAVFGFFVVGMLGAVIGEDRIRYVTPFKWFDAAYILKNGTYETGFAILAACVAVVAVAASFLAFARKDIRAQ